MLALAWLGIIGFCIIMYVVLDGFTLGTGILFPFLNQGQRDLASSVILPTWDGNQTWLVLGIASLYGAFPFAFSILLPLLYLPLLIMVVALLLRGVAFEFRIKSKARKTWDMIFAVASLITALVQGDILGDFVQGFSQSHHTTAFSGFIDFFSWFTALSLVVGYGLLGSTRLILKTSGSIQLRMFSFAKIFTWALIILTGIVSVWTPFVYPLVQSRWLNLHYMPYLAILPFLTACGFMALMATLIKGYEKAPYWLAVLVFLCPYIGFVISIFPYLVPYELTLWQAASPDHVLAFILVGACIMLPFLLAYTFYAYRIFRGKVDETIHY